MVVCYYVAKGGQSSFCKNAFIFRDIDVERMDQTNIQNNQKLYVLPVVYGAFHLSQLQDCLRRFWAHPKHNRTRLQSICSNNGQLNLDPSQHNTQTFHQLAQGEFMSFLLKGWKNQSANEQDRRVVQLGWDLGISDVIFLHFKSSIMNLNIKQNHFLCVK